CLDDILDEATRKDLFTATFCKVCRAVLQFVSRGTSHYKLGWKGKSLLASTGALGKKHAQKVHLYIPMHAEKDERQGHGKQVKTDCISFQVTISLYRNKYCNLCNMCFSSPVVALSHYLGKIHAKKLKQLSEDQAHVQHRSTSYSNTGLKFNDSDKYCKLCCAPFNSPLVAQEHYIGKKHRRNEARKKILERLGDKAVPAGSSTNGKENTCKSVGVGYYMCHICNVIVTSIETYQSHVQGNKHRIKLSKLCREAVLANLAKTSKKTYGSFQYKSVDYSKVPKAGAPQTRRYLGKTKEEEFQDKNVEGESDDDDIIVLDLKCEKGQHSSLFSETQSPTNTGENKLSSWPPACQRAQEKTPNCDYTKGYCKEQEGQVSEVIIIRDDSFSLSVADTKCSYELMLAETSTSSCRKEEIFQVKCLEEEKFISQELKYKKEAIKQKRKTTSEGADFGKEKEKQKRMKLEIDLVNEKRSRPGKNKRLKESEKGKKKPQTIVKREEEWLWDGSVLGY
ncbi:ZMAT1 protein, partial [Urocolius indicus]|nr:ZMAT1 protein [Urocolius indicus]